MGTRPLEDRPAHFYETGAGIGGIVFPHIALHVMMHSRSLIVAVSGCILPSHILNCTQSCLVAVLEWWWGGRNRRCVSLFRCSTFTPMVYVLVDSNFGKFL